MSSSNPTSSAPRKPRRPRPALGVKMQPAQQRAAVTFERILDVGAQTLADVGIDRLSTNLVSSAPGYRRRPYIATFRTSTRCCVSWGGA